MTTRKGQEILDGILPYGASPLTRIVFRLVQLGLIAVGPIGWVALPIIYGPAHCETLRNLRALSDSNLKALVAAETNGQRLEANFFLPGTLRHVLKDERARRIRPRLGASLV
jgi:hypothetical protein